MTSSRNTRLAMAAVAIGIAATVAIAVVVGFAVSVQSEQTSDTSVAATERPIPSDVYDPVRAGEEPPPGFRQLLGRDQIAPVYNPVYVASDEVDWPSDSLVLGVAGTETAKAYPITHLNQREMVIDTLDGTPILASW